MYEKTKLNITVVNFGRPEGVWQETKMKVGLGVLGGVVVAACTCNQQGETDQSAQASSCFVAIDGPTPTAVVVRLALASTTTTTTTGRAWSAWVPVHVCKAPGRRVAGTYVQKRPRVACLACKCM
jgi:hypothetical protein